MTAPVTLQAGCEGEAWPTQGGGTRCHQSSSLPVDDARLADEVEALEAAGAVKALDRAHALAVNKGVGFAARQEASPASLAAVRASPACLTAA